MLGKGKKTAASTPAGPTIVVNGITGQDWMTGILIMVGAVLVLVLLSIPKLRWWERAQMAAQPTASAEQLPTRSGQLAASAMQPVDASDNGHVEAPSAAEQPADAPAPIARASGKIIP